MLHDLVEWTCPSLDVGAVAITNLIIWFIELCGDINTIHTVDLRIINCTYYYIVQNDTFLKYVYNIIFILPPVFSSENLKS